MNANQRAAVVVFALLFLGVGSHVLPLTPEQALWWVDISALLMAGTVLLRFVDVVRRTSGQVRRAWLCWAAAAAASVVATAVLGYGELVEGHTTSLALIPQDYFFMALAPLGAIGVYLYTVREPRALIRARQVTTLGTTLCLVTALLTLFYAPALRAADVPPALWFARLSNPAGSLAAAWFAVVCYQFFVLPARRPVFAWLTLGLLMYTIGDLWFAQAVIAGTYVSGHLLEVFWAIGAACYYWAASQEIARAKAGAGAEAKTLVGGISHWEALAPASYGFILMIALLLRREFLDAQTLTVLIPSVAGLLGFEGLRHWWSAQVERRLAAEAETTEGHYQALMEEAPLAVVAIDREGRVTAVNSRLVALMGAPSTGPFLRRDGRAPAESVWDPQLAAAAERCVQVGESGSVEMAFQSAWGKDVHIRLHYGPLHDADGEPIGGQAILEDLSQSQEIRLIEAAAAAAQGLVARPADVWVAVSDALGTLGTALAADHVFLMQLDAEAETGDPAGSMRVEWWANEQGPVLDRPTWQHITFRDLGVMRWHAALLAGEAVAERPGDLSETDRALFTEHGVRSLLLVPVSVGQQCWGFIAYNHRAIDHEWTATQQSLLQTLASSIGQALERAEADAALHAAHNSLERQVIERTVALGRSESSLARAQEMALLGNWEWNVRADTQVYSDGLFRLLGDTPREFGTAAGANRYHLGFVHPDDRDEVRKAAEFAREGGPYRVEYRIVRPDGEVRSVSEHAEIVRDDDGNVVHVTGVIQDITERKQAAAALQRHADFEHLLSSLAAEFINIREEDIDAGIQHAIETVRAFTGDDGAYVYLTGPDGEDGSITHRAVAPGSGAPDLELRDFRLDRILQAAETFRAGRVVHVSSVADVPSTVPGRDYLHEMGFTSMIGLPLISGARFRGFLGLANSGIEKTWSDADIALFRVLTEIIVNALERRLAEQSRTELESQLQQAQKMEAVGTLAGGIAHDFNNLLTGILGGIELGLLDLAPDSRPAESLRQAQEAGERAAELTKQLLTLSRKQEPQMGPMEVNDVVQRTARLLQRSIPATVEVRVVTDARVPAILGDAAQFGQALLNLGINARDAMPEGGRLTFETRITAVNDAYLLSHAEGRPGKYVLVTVSDTGEGIAPGVVERIFEPFFTTKDQGKGTGLGLSMVYGCMQAHGGWVTAYSEAGLGSTFRLYLPLLEVEPEQPAAPAGRVPGGTETILVVDDTDAVLFQGRGILERCGYTVITARNGEEGLAKYRERRSEIGLVITDLVMPRCGGRDLLKALRAEESEAPVILTSGYTMSVRRDDMLAEGFAAFVPKPFDLQALAGTVRGVLDGVDQPHVV